MNYNEVKQHGTIDFPFELYKLYDPSQPRYEMAMHWHNSVEIIRVLSGELYVTLDNRKYAGVPGDIFFVNSETAHSALPKDCTYECVVFNPAFLKNGNPFCDSFIDNIIHKNVMVDEYITEYLWILLWGTTCTKERLSGGRGDGIWLCWSASVVWPSPDSHPSAHGSALHDFGAPPAPGRVSLYYLGGLKGNLE